MKEKLDKNCSTLQDYYQNNRKLVLVEVSGFLNIYLVVSGLIFSPMFFDILPMGVPTVAPLEFFLNYCFPIGALAFLWGTKLALNTKEWRMLSFNLVKFVFPFLLAIICCWFMDIEVSPDRIWWLRFLF